jgi:hypothetical protein
MESAYIFSTITFNMMTRFLFFQLDVYAQRKRLDFLYLEAC